MPTLFLIRHGKTNWTEEKKFAGWGDAPLSDTGLKEALLAAKTLKKSGYVFDVCFTSCLMRAHDTARIILNELNMVENTLHREWRLNERHYGALQTNLRSDMRERYGYKSVYGWRYDYHAQPPELHDDDPRWQEQLERFPEIPLTQHPRSESMIQAVARTQPIWGQKIAPALQSGKNVLVVAHTNSIRSLVSLIENYNDEQSAHFRISTAVPRYYKFDETLKPLHVRDLTRDPKKKLLHHLNRCKLNLFSKA